MTILLGFIATSTQVQARQNEAPLFSISQEEFLSLLIFINDSRDIDDATGVSAALASASESTFRCIAAICSFNSPVAKTTGIQLGSASVGFVAKMTAAKTTPVMVLFIS